jgi:hypothetical protein
MLVEKQYPHSTFVIIPHDGFGDRNSEMEPKLGSWPKPSLAVPGWGELMLALFLAGKSEEWVRTPRKWRIHFPG